ncbi:hypothetical protein [Sutcliffiella horikoshii]|uniref:hypothetical protein n=1 Tax=Sutcliffiella horikoshii TaxID=79883 RepID=UPI0038508848
MASRFERRYRPAMDGEHVQCMKTGDMWDDCVVLEGDAVVVEEHFDMLTGEVDLKLLEAYCYWVLEKV